MHLSNTWQKLVGIFKQRKQTSATEITWLTGEKTMKQARTLTDKE